MCPFIFVRFNAVGDAAHAKRKSRDEGAGFSLGEGTEARAGDAAEEKHYTVSCARFEGSTLFFAAFSPLLLIGFGLFDLMTTRTTMITVTITNWPCRRFIQCFFDNTLRRPWGIL